MTKKLKVLSVGWNSLGADDATSFFEGVVANDSLSVLDGKWNRWGKKCLMQLKESLMKPNLVEINFQACAFDAFDAGSLLLAVC